MKLRGPAGELKFNALNRALGNALETVDAIWMDAKKGGGNTVSIQPEVVICSVTVPPPKEGYEVLVRGWANISLSNGTALNCFVRIKQGESELSKTRLHDISSIFGHSTMYYGQVIDKPESSATYRLEIQWISERTSVELYAHGLEASYVLNKHTGAI